MTARVRVVPEMQEALRESKESEGRMSKGAEEKMGLVSAKFAIRSPVPRSALFLK
jgi:hypothetical protein